MSTSRVWCLAPWGVVSIGCACPPPPLAQDGESEATLTEAASATLLSGPGASETTAVSGGSTSSGTGQVDATDGPACDAGMISCGGVCIDPQTDPAHCGASAPCDANPGESCDPGGMGCIDGACASCDLLEDFESGPTCRFAGWELIPDWCVYAASPPSTNNEVVFESLALGTDGNRQMLYPGAEDESSFARSGAITFGQTFAFRSWHVDEGGMDGLDNKRVEIDVGEPQTLVDCAAGINIQSFCVFDSGPRLGNDWDEIVLDTSAMAGMSGTIGFFYDNGSAMQGFEQGWFVDDLRVGECGPPTGPPR